MEKYMTWLQRKGSKYNNVKTTYNGYTYDSKKEAGRAQELDLLIRGNALRGWERQIRISLDICSECLRLCSERCRLHKRQNIYHIANYFIDFVLEENDGTKTYEEIKSQITMTDVWRIKWRLTEALFSKDETKKLVVTK